MKETQRCIFWTIYESINEFLTVWWQYCPGFGISEQSLRVSEGLKNCKWIDVSVICSKALSFEELNMELECL